MQNGINLGDGQVLTVNLTVILIVFAVAFIILVVTTLYICVNVSRIVKILEQKESNRNSDRS